MLCRLGLINLQMQIESSDGHLSGVDINGTKLALAYMTFISNSREASQALTVGDYLALSPAPSPSAYRALIQLLRSYSQSLPLLVTATYFMYLTLQKLQSHHWLHYQAPRMGSIYHITTKDPMLRINPLSSALCHEHLMVIVLVLFKYRQRE